MKCICCKSTEVVKEKNDAGFVKVTGHQPKRIYRYICLNCGFVTMKVDVDAQ